MVELFSCMAHCAEAFESEVYAAMEGLTLALQWTELPVILPTDREMLLKMVANQNEDMSRLVHLMKEIRTLCSISQRILLKKIDRVHNRVAHVLANYARTGNCISVWLQRSPECVSELVLANCNPIPE